MTETVTGPYGLQAEADFVLCTETSECEALAQPCEAGACIDYFCVFNPIDNCGEDDGGPVGGDDDALGDADVPGDVDAGGDGEIPGGDGGSPGDNDSENTGGDSVNPADADSAGGGSGSPADNDVIPGDSNAGGDGDVRKRTAPESSGCASTADVAQLAALVPWTLLAWLRRRRAA